MTKDPSMKKVVTTTKPDFKSVSYWAEDDFDFACAMARVIIDQGWKFENPDILWERAKKTIQNINLIDMSSDTLNGLPEAVRTALTESRDAARRDWLELSDLNAIIGLAESIYTDPYGRNFVPSQAKLDFSFVLDEIQKEENAEAQREERQPRTIWTVSAVEPPRRNVQAV